MLIKKLIKVLQHFPPFFLGGGKKVTFGYGLPIHLQKQLYNENIDESVGWVVILFSKQNIMFMAAL